MSDLATLDIDGRIATLRLNRPDARNALCLDLLKALHVRLDELAVHNDVNVCIVTGEGRAFCAGMDLKELLADPANPKRLLTSIAELTIKLRNLPCATIARVNRAAIGGGCGLMCVCDFAITHADAKIGYPEVDLGVCPAVVAPWLIQRAGAGRARQILLQGGVMPGSRAFELGLITRVTESLDEIDEATESLAQRIASAGPAALRATRAWLNELQPSDLEANVLKGAAISADVASGPEAQENLRRIYEAS